MKTFFELREKHLTPAEMKKREEVAKAIKRENPNMPMAKKMAIATATAKKVAEATQDISSMGGQALSRIANTAGHPDSAAAKNEIARRKMKNEETELDEGISSVSDAHIKYHALNNMPHGSYSKAEISAEHNRRKKTGGVQYAAVKPSINEVSTTTLYKYSIKAAQQGGKDKRVAGQKMADEKIRKKHGYSSDAKVAAGSPK